jgi:hypothetical protein
MRIALIALIASIPILHAIGAPTQVTAQLDKNPIVADEAAILVVTANDDVDSNAFDTSPLLENFQVVNTSVSKQTQVINGNVSRQTLWRTQLIPKKTGSFILSGISVGGVSAPPLQVMVVPVSQVKGNKRAAFVTAELDKQQVYLQQQVLYRVKLHTAQELRRGSLVSPKLPDAEVRQLGKDKEYTGIVDGHRYRIIERNYAIVPQASGTFTISGPLFEGELINTSQPGFAFFNQTERVNRRAPDLRLEVLPIPSNYPHHWLPSEQVQLHQEWQPSSGEYRVGEPITRTLTLTASGVVEEQLPELNAVYPQSLRSYPEPANSVTVERDDLLIAQRVETTAIVPSAAGDYLLPAIEVAWFNTQSQQTEFARLPEKRISILPDVNQAPKIPPMEPVAVTPETTASDNDWWPHSNYWLAAGWALTILAWIVTTISRRNPDPSDSAQSDPDNITLKQLQKALSHSQQTDGFNLLRGYLNQQLATDSLTIEEALTKLGNPELTLEVEKWYQNRYSSQESQSDLNKLFACLAAIKANRQKNNNELVPLYPTQNNI